MKINNILKPVAVASVAAFIAAAANAATINVTEDITTDVTWTSDNEYILTKNIIAFPGSSLTIQPGTIIRGMSRNESPDGQAGALLITRDARIFAVGTVNNPIIFTANNNLQGDNADIPYGAFGKPVRGQWGGLVINGRAPNNLVENSSNRFVEGFPEEPYTQFGGNDVNHSSGFISYVSLSHGGDVIGADNEINGLTLASVGRGTTIQFVEVYSNLDDGVEVFGGTVNLRFIAIAFCGDDGLDTDYGWTGFVQFLFIIMSEEVNAGDHGSEQDSGKDGDDSVPFGIARIANATMIGDSVVSGDNGTTALFYQDNCGNSWYNSIFTDFSGNAILMEDTSNAADCRARWNDSNSRTTLKLRNNLFGAFGSNSNFPIMAFYGSDGVNADNATLLTTEIQPLFDAGNNEFTSTFIVNSISRQRDGGLDPRPNVTENPTAATGIYEWPEGSWFTNTGYKGAFDPEAEGTWLDGWSILSLMGHLGYN